jgi:putative transposase
MGVGELKIKLHRLIAGEIRTVTLAKSCGKWFACFSVVMPDPMPLPETGEVTGIDVGVSSFAVLSDGTVIKNPRYYEAAQAKLRRAQRKVCAERKPATGAGRLSSTLHVSTGISEMSGAIFITK